MGQIGQLDILRLKTGRTVLADSGRRGQPMHMDADHFDQPALQS